MGGRGRGDYDATQSQFCPFQGPNWECQQRPCSNPSGSSASFSQEEMSSCPTGWVFPDTQAWLSVTYTHLSSQLDTPQSGIQTHLNRLSPQPDNTPTPRHTHPGYTPKQVHTLTALGYQGHTSIQLSRYGVQIHQHTTFPSQ